MMNDVYVALGSNIGDRQSFLDSALKEIDRLEGTHVEKISSIYETEPVGYKDQEAFLNMVAKVQTVLSPNELLDKLQSIEHALKRTREIHWGPRTIDLDILLYNQENIQTEELKIPHPRMLDRGFVMIPLYELQPDLHFPHTDKNFSTIIEERIDKKGVNVWKRNNGGGGSGLFEN
ncbi:2-amino-4-hydroxy-6-hydroxymethyldihydropteridine diphosphokinase [Pseudalkalibacillus salsuginis]|uniref:2-amino-4-hydroxy-6- hydroxymethyldihydropteridine diphosphokinase n=1 Tax=Pseudalkalibacillus salsuginis TaxID=2910972 RepID=UPI001F376C82|nr:2-amino-4-hydroxy-6-hydroxymethyldihydropteridine diphosphokinase [Pseudalkalibacillus salsuginis]MCF6411893.1 2-amino-4-hydroxy-6-hydroxymethyldihydropteridine diphosphokinase [Pseudalkalibacillus salsuginis]